MTFPAALLQLQAIASGDEPASVFERENAAALLEAITSMAERLKKYEGVEILLEPEACTSCGAPIRWVRMKNTGAMNPLEPRVLNVVTSDGVVVRGSESHFAHCPNSKEHRKR